MDTSRPPKFSRRSGRKRKLEEEGEKEEAASCVVDPLIWPLGAEATKNKYSLERVQIFKVKKYFSKTF